jgi:hypothetical protein
MLSPNSDDEPTRLNRLKTITDIVGTLLMPIVVAGIGIYFTWTQNSRQELSRQQERLDDEQRQDFEKVGQLLDRLTSQNKDQRAIAMIVLQRYATDCKLAPSIVPAVIFEMGGQDESSKKIGRETLIIAGRTCPTFGREVGGALANSKETRENLQAFVPHIYIHIRDENQRPAAVQIQKALEAKGFVVPGIETVSKGPSENEVRFFRKNEDALARSVLSALPISGAATKYIGGYEYSQGIRPLHTELWLAPGLVKLTSEAQAMPLS